MDENIKKIAKDMVEVSAKVKSTDSVLIYFDHDGLDLAKEIASLCAQIGSRVWYRSREMELETILATNLTNRHLARHLGFTDNEIFQTDVVFMIRAPKDPSIMQTVPDEKMRILSRAQKPVLMDYRVNHTNWQLIYWPTEYEAKKENMPFDKYKELVFSACNQPWEEIEKAQLVLTDILDNGKTLTLIANPNDKDESKRTNLTMSIDTMEFMNSTIVANYPGSEVFSSPVRDTVNGHLYANGEYLEEGKLMKNLRFDVENGKIIKATAEVGQKFLDDILNRDEGARYFGEVAIGTNPGLRQRLFNPLLNEKVGGSFHITPGKAYETEEYNGRSVNVDNGNRSEIHWDMTIMMLPKYGGGEILVDGRTIQKDGRFIIPKLEVLNQGL